MARYEKFLPRLMLQLHECPEPVAIDALRSACIAFCEQTHWITYEPEPMPLAVGARTYPLDTPVGTVPVMIVDAWANGQRMSPTNEEALSATAPDWRTRTGTPTAYLQYVPDEVVVTPTPDVRIEQGLKLLLSTRPSQESVEVDDTLYQYWYDTIVAGALARLYNQSGRPYSNPTAVPGMRADFQSGISDALAKRQRGMTRGPMRVTMRRWI